MIFKITLIAAAGALGAVLRYGVSGMTQRITGEGFPLGTLVVNALGCFAAGFLTGALMSSTQQMREEVRVALLVGLLGGFTTYSTFAKETLALANDSEWAKAGMYVLLTNALCLIGVWIGYRLAQRIYGV
ncbi:MAG: fluoride efflux transporter CrcB [Phycisphaerales bacterium]|nr:MAG: fluoride efflux transporter CrcB [Phycisphaerales bacterium]